MADMPGEEDAADVPGVAPNALPGSTAKVTTNAPPALRKPRRAS
jgi:hypothetical protein